MLVVSFFQVAKTLAWHVAAFMAELDLVFAKFSAASLNIAVFRPWTAAHAVAYLTPFLGNTAGKSEVPFADVAIHAAWRHQFTLQGVRLHN